MECFPFSDLRIFSLSIPLCEWLTSTPFLLLVYHTYIYIGRETIVARRRLPVRCSRTGDRDQEVEKTKRKDGRNISLINRLYFLRLILLIHYIYILLIHYIYVYVYIYIYV